MAVEQKEEMALFEVRAFRRGETHDWIAEVPSREERNVEQLLEIEDGIEVD